MRIMHPLFSSPVEISSEYVTTLVIESPSFMYSFTLDIYNQINKISGETVFSKDNEILDTSKNIVMINQFVPFEMNNKPLLTKLHSKLKDIMQSENYLLDTNEVLNTIQRYLIDIVTYADGDIICDEIEDVSLMLKIYNVRFDDSSNDIEDRIVTYVKNTRIYEGDKLFVFVNAGNYIEIDKLQSLYNDLVGHDVQALFIESIDRGVFKNENRIVIDNDLCII